MFSKKKPMTKKQVRDTILKMCSLNAKLLTDRMLMNSKTPMTAQKMFDIDKILTAALKRVK